MTIVTYVSPDLCSNIHISILGNILNISIMNTFYGYLYFDVLIAKPQ